jgi:predicted RNA-binding protein with PUA-like domain
MNKRERNKMFKNLKAGDVFSFKCSFCQDDHGLLVLEVYPDKLLRLAEIKEGCIRSVTTPTFRWDLVAQELANTLDTYYIDLKTIKLESETFSPTEIVRLLCDYYDETS